MLTIRDAQMHVFGQTRREKFAATLIAHLKSLLPVAPAALDTEAHWRAFVARATAAGAGYGMTSPYAIAVLAELMLQFGEQFERSPIREWTDTVLAQPGLPGEIKAASLRERYENLTGGRPVAVVD
jgi:hypothetical protein